MRTFSRRDWLTTALAVGSVSAVAAPPPPPGKPRHFVIGQSVPLTGAASEIGLAYAAGAKLYVGDFNDKSASQGLSLELRQLDDGYRPERAVANARQLLANGADALFGFAGTASCEAAAQLARQQNALFIAPFAGSDALHDAGQYPTVFHVRPSLTAEALKMARHCATLGQTRIALLAEDDAMGQAGRRAVENAVAELKLPALVEVAVVPTNSGQVEAAATALAKAQPHVVIQAALFNTTAAFIRAMRRQGYVGSFMNFSVVGIDPLFTALGKEIAGVVVSQVVPSPRGTTVPIVREYLNAIDNSDQTPTYESLEGFIAAKALADGLRRAGGRTSDRAGLTRALAGMTDHDVGGFHLNLRTGVRDPARSIELVSVTSDGRIIR